MRLTFEYRVKLSLLKHMIIVMIVLYPSLTLRYHVNPLGLKMLAHMVNILRQCCD